MMLDASQFDEANEYELESLIDSEVTEGKTPLERLDVTKKVQGSTYLINRMPENHKHIVIFINEGDCHFDLVTCNKTFHEVAEEDIEKFIKVDPNGPFKFSQAAIPVMLRDGSSGTRGVEGGG